MQIRSLPILILLIFLSAGCASGASSPDQNLPFPTPAASLPVPQAFSWAGTQRPLLMAHSMPWFHTKKFSGSWGWHWTMDFSVPQQAEDGSWSKLASRDTPLIGPYDSNDPLVLEYQINLMKLSGIDGVIVDWYGMDYFQDYGQINASTQKLFEAVKRAGLKFAICYEDQTVRNMLNLGDLKGSDATAYGHKVLEYLQDTWFKDAVYLKTPQGRPVFFVFGPQYFSTVDEWRLIFSGIEPRPFLATLDQHAVNAADSTFPWPPMWAAQAGTLSQADLNSYLDTFYARVSATPYRVAGAFPGFDDFYKAARVSSDHRYLDERGGATLHETLQKAMDTHPAVIQLITWNDYGESTQIEPSVEQQFRSLEIVQQARRAMDSGNFTFTPQDLRLPLQIYQLREKHTDDRGINTQLDQVSAVLRAGDTAGAVKMLHHIP